MFNNYEPIYLQLVELLEREIVIGKIKPQDKLPSIRELASTYGINPNTVQKAINELEKLGIIRIERNSGCFIQVDQQTIDQLKSEMALTKGKEYVNWMHKIGIEDNDIVKITRKAIKENIHE